MSTTDRLRRLYDRRFPADALPEREGLPWYVAPLPGWLEDLGLRLVWLVVAVNLAGTAFGFWFYSFQFSITPVAAWPVVPDSPLATLFIALSLASWKLGYADRVPWLHALAFFGCIKLGAWTPFVLTAFPVEYPSGGLAALGGSLDTLAFLWEYGLYTFLVTSHLAMVVEAFLVQRYASFSVGAVAVATAWYVLNDVVDYLVSPFDTYTHTLLNAEPFLSLSAGFDHTVPAHDVAAAAAVTLTVACVFLALATRVAKVKASGET
ncbi:DUF1405 domain-containing protein [Salinirubellus salinus]|uniref:DUF1405 domain-containing protein n=1 Tax=Salinirubellus salinus TaxID=1364945 RepID=A0A9E7QZT1_9EURY|nr:DUF1405 domain-containing protein [Salinirubellus salinus]UWM53007.1 DUF1405 domain-containing protein [Salinirubellus salinus]